MTQVPWFMYQNRLGPSGGIYYPSFVPCFVVLYLNYILIIQNSTLKLRHIRKSRNELPRMIFLIEESIFLSPKGHVKYQKEMLKYDFI